MKSMTPEVVHRGHPGTPAPPPLFYFLSVKPDWLLLFLLLLLKNQNHRVQLLLLEFKTPGGGVKPFTGEGVGGVGGDTDIKSEPSVLAVS